MKKVVVDTNILFSAILNNKSNIAQIILTGFNDFQFYAPEYIRYEILKHKKKICKLACISEIEFLEIYELLLKHLSIIDLRLVPFEYYQKAEILCVDIDIDDTPFVALALYVEGIIWTGDLKLSKSLIKKGFTQIINTKDLHVHFLKERIK